MALKLGINLRTIPITANYTVTAFDDIINADATSGAITVTLPDATTIPGKQIKVNKIDTSVNTVTITGPQLINGVSSIQLLIQNDALEIASVNNVYTLVGTGLQTVQSSVVGNKNNIINGNFDFWQRQTSFAAIANDTYHADRWTNNLVGSMVQTFSRSTDVPTFAQSGFKSNYSLLLSTTTAEASLGANDYRALKYHIEGQNLAEIFGGIATLSFWVKSSKVGIYSVYFQDGAGGHGWATSITVNNASTWEKKFVNVNLTDSTGASFNFDNTLGMKFLIVLAAGSNHTGGTAAWTTGNTTTFAVSGQVNGVDSTSNTFQLAQVMFNKGSVPAPFVRAGNTIGGEFLLCLRYYFKSYNQATFPGAADFTSTWMMIAEDPNNAAWMHGKFPVPMRTVPTAQIYSASTGTAGALYYVQGGGNPVPTQFANFKSENGLGFTNNGGGVFTANGHYYANVTADAEL